MTLCSLAFLFLEPGGTTAEGGRLGRREGRKELPQRDLQAVLGPAVGHQGPQEHEEVHREAGVGRHGGEVCLRA